MSVEERLAILEQEFVALKRAIQGKQTNGNWIAKVSGSFKGDPEFGEILRLGKEIRQGDTNEHADGEA